MAAPLRRKALSAAAPSHLRPQPPRACAPAALAALRPTHAVLPTPAQPARAAAACGSRRRRCGVRPMTGGGATSAPAVPAAPTPRTRAASALLPPPQPDGGTHPMLPPPCVCLLPLWLHHRNTVWRGHSQPLPSHQAGRHGGAAAERHGRCQHACLLHRHVAVAAGAGGAAAAAAAASSL